MYLEYVCSGPPLSSHSALSSIRSSLTYPSFAIFAAKQRGDTEVTPDHLLVGCLRAISRFGIATLGPWSLDLEALGVDWMRQPDGPRPKVAYSQEAVDLFDRAAQIAKSAGESRISVNHLLAAFATEEAGLMGGLSVRTALPAHRGAPPLRDWDRSRMVWPKKTTKHRNT